ncbi:hypothetical protein HDZ31DRAFT_82849 [Schizophyllum fasciatum]
MSAITLEILKITVRPSFDLASAAFARLRQTAVAAGVKEQYYGMVQDRVNLLCWLIEWPVGMRDPMSYAGPEPAKFDFREERAPISPALTAPVCEICDVTLRPEVDRSRPEIVHSLHKTFSDCYDAPDGGFTGGHWSVNARNDRHNVYLLGWESRKLHAKYFSTPLCELELNNLAPYTTAGEGIFANLIQERAQ